MRGSLQAANKLKQFLIDLQTSVSLSSQSLIPLTKDIKYLEKCIDILSDPDVEGINDLWRDVQYLSQFFGAGYAEGDAGKQLLNLMNEFHSSLLDEVVAIRREV